MSKERTSGFNPLPLMTRPKKVALVALGPSCKTFVHEMMTNTQMKSPFDEVWTLNRGVRAFMHDKIFVMDDLKWIERHKPDYAKWLKEHEMPIITSTAYDDYPSSIAYPYHEVFETIGDDIFAKNTVAYMLAYAIHTGVSSISIYGADFIYPNGNTAEVGGQAVAYLCGMMRHFEMTHIIPGDSTLLYANTCKMDPQTGNVCREPYGYHRLREMQEEDDRNAKQDERRKV